MNNQRMSRLKRDKMKVKRNFMGRKTSLIEVKKAQTRKKS